MDIDVLNRIDLRGLRRLDDSRHNRRVCDAAAAAMIKIKGPPGLGRCRLIFIGAWGAILKFDLSSSSTNLDIC